jgi:hypothetical protein
MYTFASPAGPVELPRPGLARLKLIVCKAKQLLPRAATDVCTGALRGALLLERRVQHAGDPRGEEGEQDRVRGEAGGDAGQGGEGCQEGQAVNAGTFMEQFSDGNGCGTVVERFSVGCQTDVGSLWVRQRTGLGKVRGQLGNGCELFLGTTMGAVCERFRNGCGNGVRTVWEFCANGAESSHTHLQGLALAS